MNKLLSSRRFLAVYSGTLTLIFAATVLTGFASRAKKVKFAEMDVQRINIVEPDGTLRMVISDKALFPGIIIKGKETPHPNRRTAGMLFFNDEATENGGLTFGGLKDGNGKTRSYGHLSFDQYEQDQVLTIDAGHEGDKRKAGLAIIDRPDYPIGEFLAFLERVKGLPEDQKKAEQKRFEETHPAPAGRLYLGRTDDRSVGLKLKDPEGRDRIVIEVTADGSPAIKLLDVKGNVTGRLP
jgi:hypothetical protein